MENLVKTAKTLDTIFKILSVAIKIAVIFIAIGLVIITAAFLFDLPPALIGTDWEVASNLGFLTITVSDDALPPVGRILGQAAAELSLTLLCLLIVHRMLTCVRGILSPMTQGAPFQNIVSTNLKRLAVHTLFLGIGLNCREILSVMLLDRAFDLTHLLLSDQVLQVTLQYSFRLEFLLVSAAFLLLSYIFRYGEQLQQLSDETL